LIALRGIELVPEFAEQVALIVFEMAVGALQKTTIVGAVRRLACVKIYGSALERSGGFCDHFASIRLSGRSSRGERLLEKIWA